MIFDNIRNISIYKPILDTIRTGINFIENSGFDKLSQLKDGRVKIDGDKVFAKISSYDTVHSSKKLYESHRCYIDLQLILKGRETIFYTQADNLSESKSYNPDQDITFYHGENETALNLAPQHFAVFFPHDAHKPCCFWDRKTDVKKLVIKMKI
ncbi:MAG: YhcH/YjgK/YiaL family protein [Chitinispirillia bacterium]|jgi:YhcH/YjgK/YiaL family protein